ncbi:MAG: phosphonate C-P lyase system protein PhnG [Ktedonobacteraceae bacterium]|nr:phosphonate C-P lyase system protein PhnG [Ktedonobacteraceae bacterium]
MNHHHILANCSEEQLSRLAILVLQAYTASTIKLLSGPQRGLVMLRVRETIADSSFNAGEILVTEVKLEIDGQFGFGMIIGDSPSRAMAIALVDAALRKGEAVSTLLQEELAELGRQLHLHHQRTYNLVAATKVDFETM